MPRISKSKPIEPAPVQGFTHPESAFSKYLQEHPEGVRVTYIGKNQDGVPISVISNPNELAGTRRFVEIVMSVGKGKRRRSSPATIRRNVQICDLRKQDVKKWTFGTLAMKFKVKRQTILRILDEEQKWRDLHSQLPV